LNDMGWRIVRVENPLVSKIVAQECVRRRRGAKLDAEDQVLLGKLRKVACEAAKGLIDGAR
jgi:hypothetical protein